MGLPRELYDRWREAAREDSENLRKLADHFEARANALEARAYLTTDTRAQLVLFSKAHEARHLSWVVGSVARGHWPDPKHGLLTQAVTGR